MSTRGSFMLREAAAVAVGALLVFWAASEALASSPKCDTGGLVDKDPLQQGNQPGIVCTGNCDDDDPGTNCAEVSGSAPGYGNYIYCACPLEGEASCCHLILQTDPGGDFQAKGACYEQQAACPAGNWCRINPMSTGTVSNPYKSECATQ